jgi:hypothetical protein
MTKSKKGKARQQKALTDEQNISRAQNSSVSHIRPTICNDKLINRFYEPLVLLKILGQVQGERSPVEAFDGTDQSIRRRLLRNMSYVCDYEKGGDTTTAMALSERPELYTFWVASNVKISKKILNFVENVLRLLKRINGLDSCAPPITSDHLVKTCVDFAQSRIKKELRLLKLRIKQCLDLLRRMNSTEGQC